MVSGLDVSICNSMKIGKWSIHEKEDKVPESSSSSVLEMKIKSQRLARPSVILVGSCIICDKPNVSAVSKSFLSNVVIPLLSRIWWGCFR